MAALTVGMMAAYLAVPKDASWVAKMASHWVVRTADSMAFLTAESRVEHLVGARAVSTAHCSVDLMVLLSVALWARLKAAGWVVQLAAVMDVLTVAEMAGKSAVQMGKTRVAKKAARWVATMVGMMVVRWVLAMAGSKVVLMAESKVVSWVVEMAGLLVASWVRSRVGW